MAEPRVPQLERQLTVDEVKQLPEYTDYCEQVYLKLFHFNLDQDDLAIGDFCDKILTKAEALAAEDPQRNAHIAAARVIISELKNGDAVGEILGRYLDVRIEELLRDYKREIKANSTTFIRAHDKALNNYARREQIEEIGFLNQEGRSERVEDYIEAVAIANLLEDLEREDVKGRILTKLKAAINSLLNIVVDEKLLTPPVAEQVSAVEQTPGQKIELALEAEGEHFMLPDQIPRIYGPGVVNLPVVIDVNGGLHARSYTVNKPGKSPEHIKFVFDELNAEEQLRGEITLAFHIKSREGSDPVIMHLERPNFLFAEGVAAQPVAFIKKTGLYILPDGNCFAIRNEDASFIDVETGFARTAQGVSTEKFPVVEIRNVFNAQAIGGEAVEKVSGYEKLYSGTTFSPEVYAKRLNLEMAFAHYYRTARLQKIEEHAPYALSIGSFERQKARQEIRAASRNNPLEVVVSVTGGSMNAGFKSIGDFLKDAKKRDRNDRLVAELLEMHRRARNAYDTFGYQQSNPNNQDLLERETHWDAYIVFFRMLDRPDVKKLFGTTEIRRNFFPSDLDGETALQFFDIAGIHTRTIPFTPDQQRGDKPYIERAIHIDISHGRGTEIRAKDNQPWNGVTVFLDEDDSHVLSSTHAAHDHLLELGFLEDSPLAWYLIKYIDEEDAFRGLYETPEGCAQVVENNYKNIFGIGGECIRDGRYDAVIAFFKETLPKIESKVLSNNPDFKLDSEELRTAVLRDLVTFDVRPFFREKIGKQIDDYSLKLGGKRERSAAAVGALSENGFEAQTVFGRTLFDPFNTVEHRGLAAFAAGFDCFVGYNRKYKIGVVNISPFQSAGAELRKIPPDFYKTQDDKPIGTVVKGGRYLAMNSASRIFTDFKQIADKLLYVAGVQIDPPEGIYKFVNAEAEDWERTEPPYAIQGLYESVIPPFVREKKSAPDPIKAPVSRAPHAIPPMPPVEPHKPPVDLDDDPDPDLEPEPELPDELPVKFVEYQNGFDAAISEIAVNPMKFGPGAHELRQRLVGAMMGMSAEVGAVPAPGKINPRFELLDVAEHAMVEDIRETMTSVAGKLRASNIEQAIGAHDRREFLRAFVDQTMIDAGLDIYEAVIDSEEIDEIFAEWVKTI